MSLFSSSPGRKKPDQAIDATIPMSISGLGIIFYSPFATAHIRDGEDYLQSNFWQPSDVARHVMDCTISAVGTGSPGDFVLRVHDGAYPGKAVRDAMAAVRVGTEVRESTLCFRDLCDLMDWAPACPPEQQLRVPDGFYRITVFTSRPPSGTLGDQQVIDFHFERVDAKPSLRWEGVPDISGMRG